MKPGVPSTQLKARLLASEEFYRVQGGGTLDGYLSAMFRKTVGRDPSPAERATVSRQLRHGVPRTQVAAALLARPTGRGLVVQSVYHQFLHRGAEPPGSPTGHGACDTG